MQATHPYGVRDVERLLGLSRNTLRALVAARFVSPTRGERNRWRFSFQDLIVLRTAQALVAAKVPARRITRSLRELRRHLPESVPLSGLSIGADGDRVVVREGTSRWQAESGQYLLQLEVRPDPGSLATLPIEEVHPHGWFDEAVALEERDPAAAMAAYAKAIDDDPSNVDARINLGLLLHEAGRLREAESVYREALDACGSDAVLLFNVGVLLEDLGRRPEAAEAYEAAVRVDPAMADAHYNLAILCRELGHPQDAIRHMAEYRRLNR